MVVWHVAISGFRQAEDRPNGMLRLWLDTLRPLAGPAVFARYAPWNHDWRGLARLIDNTRGSGLRQNCRVGIYAYSYGAGWGAIRLADALAALGIEVAHCVFSDPVHRYALPVRNWRALRWFAGRQKVIVPRNVRAVDWFRQESDPLLWGHEVVAADPAATRISPATLVPGVRHDAMDDLREFHERATFVARNLSQGWRMPR